MGRLHVLEELVCFIAKLGDLGLVLVLAHPLQDRVGQAWKRDPQHGRFAFREALEHAISSRRGREVVSVNLVDGGENSPPRACNRARKKGGLCR